MSVPSGITSDPVVPGWHDPATGEAIELAAWEHEPRGRNGRWVKTLGWDELDQHLERWFRPDRLEARRVRHPRSGYMVPAGIERRVYHPERSAHGNESLGTEGPAVFEVYDRGNPLSPEYNSLKYMVNGVHLRTEPIRHVYRGVSEGEWRQIQQRGYMHSDRRGTISPLEGTNAAADPRSAVSYLPGTGPGRVLKIEVRPGDQWFTINADEYIRTRKMIPADRIVAASPVLAREPKYGGLYLPG